MKLKLFLFLTILLVTLNAPAQKREYIGYEHKGVVYGEKLPNGFKDMGGGLLSDEDYGVTRFVKGKKHYLWLEKITGRDRQGVPYWKVKDVLEFGFLRKNQEFLFSYSSTCTTDGEPNIDTVVLAEFDPKSRKYKVIKAWRADVERERFERISVAGIECEPEKTGVQFARK